MRCRIRSTPGFAGLEHTQYLRRSSSFTWRQLFSLTARPASLSGRRSIPKSRRSHRWEENELGCGKRRDQVMPRVPGGPCPTSCLRGREVFGRALEGTEPPSTLALVGRASGPLLLLAAPGLHGTLWRDRGCPRERRDRAFAARASRRA